MNTPPTAPPAAIATIVGTKPRPSSIPIAPRTIVNAEELAVNQNGNRPRAVPKRCAAGIGLIVYCSTTSLIGYPCSNGAKNGLISADHSAPPMSTLDRATQKMSRPFQAVATGPSNAGYTESAKGSSAARPAWNASIVRQLTSGPSTTSLMAHRSPAARPCGRFSHAGRARGAASGSRGGEQAEGHGDPGEDRTGPQRAGCAAGQRGLERGHRPVPGRGGRDVPHPSRHRGQRHQRSAEAAEDHAAPVVDERNLAEAAREHADRRAHSEQDQRPGQDGKHEQRQPGYGEPEDGGAEPDDQRLLQEQRRQHRHRLAGEQLGGAQRGRPYPLPRVPHPLAQDRAAHD